jgi:hypothetical protein
VVSEPGLLNFSALTIMLPFRMFCLVLVSLKSLKESVYDPLLLDEKGSKPHFFLELTEVVRRKGNWPQHSH